MGQKQTGTILIRGARQLLTLRGPKDPRRGAQLKELGIVYDGAMLIRDGLVAEVGPSRRLENLDDARDATEINAAGRVVMPGFVDSHTHLLWPPAGPDGADPERALRYIRMATGQRIESRAREILETMARHGTTTVEVKTGFGPEENVEAKLLRVLAALSDQPVETMATFLWNPPEHGTEEALEIATNVILPRIRRGRLAHFADVAWRDDPALAPGMRRYLHTAGALGFRCKVHAHRPLPAAAIVEAAAHRAVSVDHLEHAAEEEARLLAGASIIATLLPADTFRLRGPAAPARIFADNGVAIALASNYNPHLTPTFNMQSVVSMAARELGLTTEEAICAATINGAHALDVAARTGSLECGKSADVLILNANDYRELSANFGGNLVRMALRHGEPIYREAAVGPGNPEILQRWPKWPGRLA
jgi:imidazolonepropionase